jgi:hypothetical protein
VKVNHNEIIINNLSDKSLTIVVHGKEYRVVVSEKKSINHGVTRSRTD